MADNQNPREHEGDEEDEEDLDETQYISQKDAVLFAIDVSESMLTPSSSSDDKKADRDSPTTAAIKCAYQIMQQRIISHPKDMMGVLLFGTEQTKFQDEEENDRGGYQYPHLYLLCDLEIPSVDDVKALKAIVEGDEEAKDLLVPAKEPVSMSNILFCANQIFTTRAPNFGSRRLFIITDKDDPHASDKTARSQATVRAKDLYDLGVVIELFPISHSDHEFDRSKFYDDIIYRDPAEGQDQALVPSNFKSSGTDGISLLIKLITDINSKHVAKRAIFSNLPFEIGNGFQISVKGYNLLQLQKPARSGYVWEGGEEKQWLEGESSTFDAVMAKPVEKENIKKAFKFGGSQVLFTPEEVKKVKDFGSPILRIIGFKPQSMLPLWASVKKSTFIYPSEEQFVGSTRVFSALWAKLVRDKKMGLAWYIARTNANPVIVAILPSEERIDDLTNVPVVPAGLWLYQLPFNDDLRTIGAVPKPLVAPDILKDEMRKVVQQLQLPKALYDPSKYPNPALQWHYKILQTIALEEELPTKAEDKTIPKYRQIDKRAGEYSSNWRELLDEHVRKYQKESYGGIDGTSVKHDRETSEEPSRKRVKASTSKENLDAMNARELKALTGKGDLKKYTVAEIKDLLATKGLSNSGLKGELIERVEQWLEEQ